VYSRPDNGHIIFRKKVRLDNRHVVPYNLLMLKITKRILTLSGAIKPMSSSIFISMLQRVLIFQKLCLKASKTSMVLRLMRSWNIDNAVTYVIKMVGGGYMVLIYTVRCLLLKDCLFIC